MKAVTHECFDKKGVLEKFVKFPANETGVTVSFLITLPAILVIRNSVKSEKFFRTPF